MSGTLFQMNNGLKPCSVCTEIHPIQTRCSHETMVKRIRQLLEANSWIPQLIKANKEAVDAATGLQQLLKLADSMQTILSLTLQEYGEVGVEIHKKYLSRVDDWAKEYTNQDTSEQSSNQNESTIQSEIENKKCIEETMTGESIEKDS